MQQLFGIEPSDLLWESFINIYLHAEILSCKCHLICNRATVRFPPTRLSKDVVDIGSNLLQRHVVIRTMQTHENIRDHVQWNGKGKMEKPGNISDLGNAFE